MLCKKEVHSSHNPSMEEDDTDDLLDNLDDDSYMDKELNYDESDELTTKTEGIQFGTVPILAPINMVVTLPASFQATSMRTEEVQGDVEDTTYAIATLAVEIDVVVDIPFWHSPIFLKSHHTIAYSIHP